MTAPLNPSLPDVMVLPASALRADIAESAFDFTDTSELLGQPLPWIGQERARAAARLGLDIDQPGYNLCVMGELGSGRSTLLQQMMREVAASRAVPPDLCYLYNFDMPERPRALRMPTGQGRQLRQMMAEMVKTLEAEIPRRLDGPDFKAESERIQKVFKAAEAKAYDELASYGEQRHFALHRDGGNLVFTLRDAQGRAMTEESSLALSREQRAEIEGAEQELHAAITGFIEKMRPLERVMNESLAALRRQLIKPLVEDELQTIRNGLRKQIKDSVKLGAYLDQVLHDVLENVGLFQPIDTEDELRQEALAGLLARYRVNLLVDNSTRQGAPVIVEDNPRDRALFGGIDYQYEDDALVTDFSRIRAGSLLRAHGGFLLLHLRDLMGDEQVWEKLRRFLRSGRVQIEESGVGASPITAVSLRPESVDVDVKIVLIASVEHYYALQEMDPEFMRHFRIKVDFAESIPASAEVRHQSAVFMAHACARLGLPHCSAAAVARLLEQAQREVDDQARQSAVFAGTEALVIESAAFCRARGGTRIEGEDVTAALRARDHRHDYPEQRLLETVADGERLMTVQGERIGQLNGLSQIDLGDYRFGFPVRVTARTFAGDEGLLNIEREVEMSGPIHDKGVLILHSYLSALFGHIAPLAMDASVVFEQEYHGVEGDSASCAEFYALLSSLAGVPLRQGIAVTGALNQYGEVLPVGGVNEKIEGYFRVCQTLGLDGQQGVLIPRRNQRHLMLNHAVVEAVAQGRFHIYVADHVREGLALLTGMASGMRADAGDHFSHASDYAPDTVLGRAQKTLQAFRRACQAVAGDHAPKPAHRRLRG